MGYNIEDNGIRIHRMDDAVCQMYDFAQGRWVNSAEIMDMFIGELWADKVSEAEANSVTPRAAAESIPCDNGADSSGQKSMLAAKGASQSLHRDPECRRITGKDGGMEMGARRSGSRIFIVMLAILAYTLIVVGAVLIATGRLCITSSHRPVDRYEGASGAGDAGLSADPAATVDADADGIADNGDVLAAALAYIQTRPHYKSVYYPSGYPDDEHGVCTDVVAIACREAGYDLQALVAADVARRPEAYAIEIPDPAIDFRRTPNLKVFFDAHAQRLTSDARNISEWRGGDIVLYEGHIGIVSDRRNERGVPYLIHHSGPFQLRYEEDKLQSYGHIVGHYRLDPTCFALLSQGADSHDSAT